MSQSEQPDKYATVWPCDVPPVCHASWTAEDWHKWDRGNRPKDYHGGQFDRIAWADYLERKRNENRDTDV